MLQQEGGKKPKKLTKKQLREESAREEEELTRSAAATALGSSPPLTAQPPPGGSASAADSADAWGATEVGEWIELIAQQALNDEQQAAAIAAELVRQGIDGSCSIRVAHSKHVNREHAEPLAPGLQAWRCCPTTRRSSRPT